jgi:hypothetical protein
MNDPEMDRRLEPYVEPILEWSMLEIAEACRAHGVPCAALFVPTTEENASVDRPRYEQLMGMARNAGFITLSLEGAYGAHPRKEIQLAAWDTHPGAVGHLLLGQRLSDVLRAHSDALHPRFTSAAGASAAAAGTR